MASNHALRVALVALAVWNAALVALLFTRSAKPAWIHNGLISSQASETGQWRRLLNLKSLVGEELAASPQEFHRRLQQAFALAHCFSVDATGEFMVIDCPVKIRATKQAGSGGLRKSSVSGGLVSGRAGGNPNSKAGVAAGANNDKYLAIEKADPTAKPPFKTVAYINAAGELYSGPITVTVDGVDKSPIASIDKNGDINGKKLNAAAEVKAPIIKANSAVISGPVAANSLDTKGTVTGTNVKVLDKNKQTKVELSDDGTVAGKILKSVGGAVVVMSGNDAKFQALANGDVITQVVKAASGAFTGTVVANSVDVKDTATATKIKVLDDKKTTKVELSADGSIKLVGGGIMTMSDGKAKFMVAQNGDVIAQVVRAASGVFTGSVVTNSLDIKTTGTAKKLQIVNDKKAVKAELTEDGGIKGKDFTSDGGSIKVIKNLAPGKVQFLVANTGEVTAQGPVSGSAVLVKVDGKTAASISDQGALSVAKIDAGSAKLETLASGGISAALVQIGSGLDVKGTASFEKITTTSDSTFGGEVLVNKSFKVLGDTTLGNETLDPGTVQVKGKFKAQDVETENMTVNNEIKTKTITSSTNIIALGELRGIIVKAPTCACSIAPKTE